MMEQNGSPLHKLISISYMADMKDTKKTAHLTDRALLKVSGRDASSFLQGIISSDISRLEEEKAGFTTLLTPQGKIAFEFFIIPFEEGYLIDCHQNIVTTLSKKLRLYKLRAAVEIDEMNDDWTVLASFGDHHETATGITISDPRLVILGTRHYGKTATISAALSNITASLDDYYHWQIENGVASLIVNFDTEQVFILDVNYDALQAVSYQKGCFVGQEVTSRMKRKGNIRKRTLIVKGLDNIEIPHPSNNLDVMAQNTKIGSLLMSGIDNKRAALALIRVDRLEGTNPSDYHIDGVSISLTQPTYLQSVD